MRTFRCRCGARIFFENTRCLSCGRGIGFLPDAGVLVALESPDGDLHHTTQGDYRMCTNYVEQGVCNWMVPVGSPSSLCQACDLNRVIPDLSEPGNRALWQEVETAKRRLVYTLNGLGLPVHSKRADPVRGLAFDIKADAGATRVLTGHDDGLITLNLAEADAAQREQSRSDMKERYRTLLGHFRHEVGHYYWDVLVAGSPRVAEFRSLFGDERRDYAEALRTHYGKTRVGSPPEAFISWYAASHPWEDFAETFAHYLHLVDTVQTAQDFGITGELPRAALPMRDFERAFTEWTELTVVLNALNRSMGMPDAYPFAITGPVKQKLRFVHSVVLPRPAGSS